MLDLSSIVGRLARAPLRLVPRGAVLPVLRGPLKGARWTVGAGPHGCWLGIYEGHKPRLMASFLSSGACVYDIGANAGYYTLLASRCVGSKGHVYSFEPLPDNLVTLREHVRINECSNTTVIPAAVSDREGSARFAISHSRLMGRLSSDGSLEVELRTVDGMLARGELLPPSLIKIDVEGAEASVLRGAAETILQYKPIILLAGHGTRTQLECVGILQSLGYRVEQSGEGGMYESLAIPV